MTGIVLFMICCTSIKVADKKQFLKFLLYLVRKTIVKVLTLYHRLLNFYVTSQEATFKLVEETVLVTKSLSKYKS